MRTPRIALIMDHPNRDLAGIVLTALELCQRGAVCYIVPLNLQEKEIWSLAPDFVLLNFFRRGNEQMARQMLEAGIQFGLLDTEGGIWANPESYMELIWQDRSLLAAASCACMWGPRLANYMVAQGMLTEQQVSVTGCPRFDLYNHVWRNVLAEDGEEGEKNRRAERLLINTNFTLGNPRFATAEENFRYCREVFGWPDDKIRSMTEAEEQAIEASIGMARALARDFPGSQVVLRPHPFENPERYRKGVAGVDNVEINFGGPVQPQIFRASAVIQRSCSTAIEAVLAGVPALSPQWVPAPVLIPSSEAVSAPCRTYEDLRTAVADIFEGKYLPPEEVKNATQTVVHDWFYRPDGLAHERVSDTVLRSIRDEHSVNTRLCSRYMYGLNSSSKWNGAHLSGAVRYYGHLSPDWSFRSMRRVPETNWTRKDKYFGVEEVGKLVERVQKIRRQRGCDARPVSVDLAREHSDYSRGYYGHSVRLTTREGA